ncbi:HNH endonuclease [Clostridium estertheticum]|uniref:HNH endonuclease n=1 Tax=Clostridium estertheticum TaxID=238834 RepID=UPI001C0C10F9|nr:HNH endonuclease [Clostridium estertheticum]MBU3186553.1 HNH endonuclease [Clostridium estertheticum]
MVKTEDLIGQTFGRLTVIERAADYIAPKGRSSPQWLCSCGCKKDDSNYIIVLGSSLKSGHTKSCGCLNRERNRSGKKMKKYNINKIYNRYNLTGEYGIGYTEKDEKFYFDLEDYDKIKDYHSYINDLGYVNMTKSNTQTFMHRRVMNAKKGELVDHIDHNKADNRKENLRIVTNSQNGMNTIISSNNTSGTKGVRWHKKREHWIARIEVDNKEHQKEFINKKDAIAYRKLLEIKYHGEYALKEGIKG